MTPRTTLALLAFAPFLALACGESKSTSTAPTPAASAAPVVRGAAPAPSASASSSAAAAPKDEYSENDFVENDRNRDPFRSYLRASSQSREPTRDQRNAVLSQYAIDELKLVAIVGGADEARAMLVDPSGKGWVITKGKYLGRPEVVHTGGQNGTDYSLHWRIDRIREGDVVLIREDPANAAVPPATRVIPLRSDGEKGT